MTENWFEGFFDSLSLDFWRQANSDEETEAEVGMVERLLELQRGARVLDVPCGTGRHLLGLAARGYRVTGADLSPEAVRTADREAAAAGLAVEISRQDMRSLPWVSRFDGACCLGNSFGYFDSPGSSAFFAAVSRALKPGAKFLLETSMVAESLLPHLDERHWLRVGDFLLLVENDYQETESRLDTEYTFVRAGESHRRVARHFVFTVAELCRMLERNQLVPESLFSSTELDPFELGSSRLFVLSRKDDRVADWV